MTRVIALALLSIYILSAQDPVPREFAHYRVWAVVRRIGGGKPDHRLRVFEPSPAKRKGKLESKSRPNMFSYSIQLSDYRGAVPVECVGLNPSALKFIVTKDPPLKIFKRDEATKKETIVEFKKHRRHLTLDWFAGSAE